jgi:hypothetical protein
MVDSMDKNVVEKRSHDLASDDYSNGKHDLNHPKAFDGTAHEAAERGHVATDKLVSLFSPSRILAHLIQIRQCAYAFRP